MECPRPEIDGESYTFTCHILIKKDQGLQFDGSLVVGFDDLVPISCFKNVYDRLDSDISNQMSGCG